MDMKKLHMGTMAYGFDSMDEVAHQLAVAYGQSESPQKSSFRQASSYASRGRRDMSSRVKDVVTALALCHNVRFVRRSDVA
jgi:phospholipid-translocating ATPase